MRKLTPKPRQKRVICIPCDLDKHNQIISDTVKYRAFLDKLIEKYPELFPQEITYGYHLKELLMKANSKPINAEYSFNKRVTQ